MMTSSSRRLAFRCLANGTLLLLLPACAPRVVLQKPVEWPAEWSGRRLYNTPRAYIYAGTAAAAGEADGLIDAVANEFAHDTAAGPTKGLVIVNDRPGESPIARWGDLLRVQQRQQATNTRPATMPAEELEEKLRKADAQLAGIGITLDTVLAMAAIPLEKDDVPHVLTFPGGMTATADWAVILPTRSLLTDASRKMMRAAMKQQKTSLIEQVIMAPLLAIVEPLMVNALAAQRDLGVYRAMVYANAGWTRDDKRRIYTAYDDRKTEKVTKDMEAGVETAKAQHRPPATAPRTPEPGTPTTAATQPSPATSATQPTSTPAHDSHHP